MEETKLSRDLLVSIRFSIYKNIVHMNESNFKKVAKMDQSYSEISYDEVKKWC